MPHSQATAQRCSISAAAHVAMIGSSDLLLHACMPSIKECVALLDQLSSRTVSGAIEAEPALNKSKAYTFCMLYSCAHHHDAPLLQEEAVEWASEHPLSVDAILTFGNTGTEQPQYTIRGNHTDLPSTRLLYNEFDLLPDPQYKLYWLFANLQQSLDR